MSRNSNKQDTGLCFPKPIVEEDLKNSILKATEPPTTTEPFRTFSGEELLDRKTETMPTLLNPILPKVGLAALAGSSDTGKSTFLRQLAISVALGQESFLGWKLETQYRRSIYVSTEDDDYAISYLLRKTNKVKNLPSNSFKRLSFIFDTSDLLERLTHELEAFPVDLIVIDAFADLYGKSMNDTNQVRTFLNDFSQLAQQYKCLIIFLHHTGKRTEELEPSKHNLLGSQGFEAKMRLVIELRNAPENSSIKHLCIVKGNYLSREHKEESYALNFSEDLEFTNTGIRCAFSELKSGNSVTALNERIKILKEEGKSQIEIAKELDISQSTVSRILKKC